MTARDCNPFAHGWVGTGCALALALATVMGCDRQGRSFSDRLDSTALAVPPFILSEEPVLSIGGGDEEEGYAIGQTMGALRLSDGRVVLADGMTLQLRYYDGRGRHLRTVGGEGNGPGELRRIHSFIRMRSDTVAVWDASQRRVSVFSPNGDHSYTITNPGWSTTLSALQRQYPRSYLSLLRAHLVDAERVVFQVESTPDTEMIKGSGMIQDTLPLLALGRTGENGIELGMFAGMEFFAYDLVAALSLGENLRVAAVDDVVYAGSTRDRAIKIISAKTGEVVGSIALSWDRRAPSPNDVSVLGQRMMDGLRPNLKQRMSEYVAAIPWPDSLPMFSDLLVGSDRRVWVQKFRAPTDATQEWLVFGPSGDVVASFTMDPSLRLLDVGNDYALVQSADELDVERVTMHRLQPPAADH